MVYFPYSFLRQHYLDQVCGFVLSQCWAPLEYFSSCCESYNPKRLANVVKKNNLAFIIYFFLLHLQKDSIIMAKNNYTDDKSLNRGLAITSILLLIVVGSVIAFIIYIRGIHSARQDHIRETAKEIAVEDSLNRIEAAKITRESEIEAEQLKARQAETKEMDAYIDNMVEKELKALEEQENSADGTAGMEEVEEEDWGEDEEDVPAAEPTQAEPEAVQQTE